MDRCKENRRIVLIETIIWNSNLDKTVLFTQSAHTELLHRPSMTI